MASRLITANYPLIVRYLPNLDAAVRHFTLYLGQDANRIESTQEMIRRDGLAVSAEVLMSDQRKTLSRIDGAGLSLTDIPYEQSKITGVNIELSVLEQFAPGTEKTINIIPTVMDSLECIAQVCPTALKKELKELFPGNEKLCKAGSSEALVTVITLSQHTVNDMSAWNIAVESEREQLLEKFITGAKEICQALNQAGYWADFIDPSSGAPYFGAHTNTTLFETDERYKYLGFDIDDLGCCKVIRHKQWGTHAYVGSLFTDAPMNLPVIQKLMQN